MIIVTSAYSEIISAVTGALQFLMHRPPPLFYVVNVLVHILLLTKLMHLLFIYQGEIRHLITSLKFGAHTKNARLLGMLLAEHLKQTAQVPDLIVPVPLHKFRYRERGFNQAIEIAKIVSKELRIPLDITSCIRHHDTPHQIALPAKQRHKNMENVFTLIKPINLHHVAILDDVMTTGSTVHELANLLKKAGVSRVDVWACARA